MEAQANHQQGSGTAKVFLSAWGLFKLLFLPEKLQVTSALTLRPLDRFVAPGEAPAPTVDIHTRCALESLREYRVDGYLPGLTDTNLNLVQTVFKSLIRERAYKTCFPMSQLHGFSASKCTMSWDQSRAAQPNMASMGRLVDDLRDLKGKQGGEVIDACLAWGELRLGQGIKLMTDTWHKRYYWRNSGGSHHMAVLCYELQRQGKEWATEVEILEYGLDLSSLDRLSGRVSVFVIMRQDGVHGYEQIFSALPRYLQSEGIRTKLGVAVPSPGLPSSQLGVYQLVFVDHSQPYASIALRSLDSALAEGRAMHFHEFLRAWEQPAPPGAPVEK